MDVNYAPDAHFDEIAELGTGYIGAVFPLIGPQSDNSPIGIPPPPVTAAADFLVSILSSFSLADAGPVVLTFELNGVAALLPYDRLMGVLPNKDWFTRFSAWSDVTGFSLGEFASRAVIFLPRKDDGNKVGPQWTLPAQLGHTFGLSVDSRLKTSWVCDIDWPVVGHAACGLVGEVRRIQPRRSQPQARQPRKRLLGEARLGPAALAPLADEQCDSHCLMGGSPVSPENNWAADGRWIDNADYDHLIDKLAQHPDPEIVFVSGMISWLNQPHVGRAVRLGAGVPDHRGNRGMYGFRFVNREGRILSEVGLPVAWNHANSSGLCLSRSSPSNSRCRSRRHSWRSGIAAAALA